MYPAAKLHSWTIIASQMLPPAVAPVQKATRAVTLLGHGAFFTARVLPPHQVSIFQSCSHLIKIIGALY